MWLRNLLLLTTAALIAAGAEDDIDHGKALTDWLKEMDGGFIHPSLELRKEGGYYGMFANDLIEENDMLLRIPREMVLGPKPDPIIGDRIEVLFEGEWYKGRITEVHPNKTYQLAHDDGDLDDYVPEDNFEFVDINCKTVQTLMEEMELDGESKYAPYVKYLKDQPKGQIPSGWSEAGKDLLLELLSHFPKGQETLPPGWPTGHIKDFHEDCDRKDPDEEHAYLLLMQRGWDDKMIPVFDMMSHGNGAWLNTKIIGSVHDEDSPIMVHSSRDIQPGEQIYTTYNFCEDCGNRRLWYGTPEIVRDYGFVEKYPQRWVFPHHHVIFDLEKANDESDDLEVHWTEAEERRRDHRHPHPPPPTKRRFEMREAHIPFFTEQLQRLKNLGETAFKTKDPNIPDAEWETLSEFREAFVTAISHALDKSSFSTETCMEGSCDLSLSTRYDTSLDQERREKWKSGRPETCDDFREFHVSFWEYTEIVETAYQRITYINNPRMDPPDTCFMLDKTWQQCTSYRPQYHEMSVHYAARYLDSVKRVLFVGGGDSMLLHDILLYPTLEKVIGLEIDQFVTRLAFKHFGAQPHYDDERVEWWYGDAAKSMLMLPRESYGTFDLVLVDLSETVASLSVTEELDIMEALSLLIKPNGILMKNEYAYFPKHRKIFRDTLHIHYYHTPIVCSQSLMLGSHAIDFLRDDFKDHGIGHIYELLDEPHVRYEIARDYQRNATNPRHFCRQGQSSEINDQVQSPGVTMIVEAENAKVKDMTSKALKGVVENVLKKQKLKVLSTVMSDESVTLPVTATILEEGYVVARAWPEESYCAFDIHLWSSFEKHDSVKNALINAIGSKVEGPSSSSYRIVSGGMFGVSTWKQDEKKRGPSIDDCDGENRVPEKASPELQGTPDQSIFLAALEESLDLVVEDDVFDVAVLCGKRGELCKSIDVVKKSKRVANVIEIYNECSELVNGVEYMEDYNSRLLSCEVTTWQFLQRQVEDKKKIRAIVVDSGAERLFASVLLTICKSTYGKRLFLRENVAVVAPIFEEDSTWRKNFVNTFRLEIFPVEPSFKSEVYFNSTANGESSMFGVSIASSGDILFFEHLVEYVEQVEKAADSVVGIVDNVRGGDFLFQDPMEPDHIFLDDDFNLKDGPLKQFRSQKPLALQVLSQLEAVKEEGSKAKIGFISSNSLKIALKVVLKKVVNADSEITFEEFHKVGEGVVLVAIWSGGNVIVPWDGRDHFDINLFTYEEDFDMATKFEETFIAEMSNVVKLALRDKQPRGIGRVVNFADDLERTGETPRWG